MLDGGLANLHTFPAHRQQKMEKPPLLAAESCLQLNWV
jgi:hypothetical protein